MRQALTGNANRERSEIRISRWAELPGLCCQAAGGEAEWADDVTLAWLLFYAAADLMDSVQDQDEPDEWWREKGPGAALAAASGLYFSGSSILDRLHGRKETSLAASAVIADFHKAFLVMTGGQFLDLTARISTLEDYWRLAEAKSGAFFQLACLAGSRLATIDREILHGYGTYGLHMGLLIQVMDDLDDVRRLRGLLPARQKKKIQASLPYIYAIEMNPANTRERLASSLAATDQSQQAVDDLVSQLDECGAALYVSAEMEHQRLTALQGLERAAPASPAKEALVRLISDL